jgi:hypothetical protein
VSTLSSIPLDAHRSAASLCPMLIVAVDSPSWSAWVGSVGGEGRLLKEREVPERAVQRSSSGGLRRLLAYGFRRSVRIENCLWEVRTAGLRVSVGYEVLSVYYESRLQHGCR